MPKFILMVSPTFSWYLGQFIKKRWDVLGIGPATNDVGIISSPNGTHVALAVFIAGSKAPLEKREKMISDVALAVVKAMQ